MADYIKVTSINVRGLRNNAKRKRIFKILKEKKVDIACLQETYITKEDAEKWKREWGGELTFFEGTTHGRGQLMLIKNRFPFKWSIEINEDRITALKVYAEKEIAIFNVYAPCGQRNTMNFLNNLKPIVEEMEADMKIVCGDFNTVMCNDLDIISGDKKPASLVKAFNDFTEECALYDIWRIFNPETKEYSWSRTTNNKFTARRLDYILINEVALDRVSETNIFSVASSDHRGVEIALKCSNSQRGPGYYKLNNLLLNNKEYLNKMNDLIDRFLAQHLEDSPVSKWELLKINIKEASLQFSKQLAKHKRSKLADLYHALNACESSLANDPDNLDLQRESSKLKTAAEILEQDRLKSSQFRSKQVWIEQGDKSSKYFLNLEKHKAESKLIPTLELDNGVTITDQFEILKAQREYYKELYNKETQSDNIDIHVQRFLGNNITPTLTETEKEKCEGLISVEEASLALKMLNNGSSPGIDGLTTEFFKCFWAKIGTLVVDSFNESFENGTLSYTQSSAVLTLIHKGKDLPRNKLQNWRPISLTNTDYKILAKCLANRVCKVIEKIVSEDQVGYIKGRNISTTLRTIDDIIEYWKLKEKPGILLALDFQKAFDSISKKYMLCAFKRFGFGTDFLQWVSTLFNDTRSSIIYNGWVSESFNVRCGIRQGCPFSPLAFIIGVELLAIRLRASDDVKGLTVNVEQILKILLYADDITVFVENENEVQHVILIINEFSLVSGLNLNMNKSEIMGIGVLKDRRFNCGMKWVNEIKILGVYFSNINCASLNKKNWNTRVTYIKKNHSTMGKKGLEHTW